MLPSPSELHYFLEVANTLNISRASERLGISQPSLSLAVQRMESSLGAPLLIRSKSGVRLTRSGQRLVTQARLLLGEWEKIRGDAMKEEDEIGGRYVIGCHPSVALYTLPGFLPALLKESPALEIKLVHDLSRRVTEDVISFKIDFGIVVNPIEHPDLVIRVLTQDEVTLWCGPEIHNPGVLICDPELLQSQAILKVLGKRGFEFKRMLTSSNLEVITALVAAGGGIGVLPGRVARRLPSEKLRPYSPKSVKGAKATGDVPRFADRICLIFRRDAQNSKASRALVRSIENHLRENGFKPPKENHAD